MNNTVLGGRNLQAFLPLILGQLLDNAKVGAIGTVRVNVALGTADTTLSHQLGRTPNGYIPYRNSSGGVVYDASTGTTDWTNSSIVVRSTSSGIFSILIL